MKSGPVNLAASRAGISNLVDAIQQLTKFRSAKHLDSMECGRRTMLETKKAFHERELQLILETEPPDYVRAIERGRETGSWLTITPMTLNRTVISPLEFTDGLSLRYHLILPDFPKICDGFNSRTSVRHALKCNHGGMVISRHNKVRDELSFILSQALTPSSVRSEPLIFPTSPTMPTTGMMEDEREDALEKFKEEAGRAERGDISVRGLWECQTTCIVDVRLTDSDQKSWVSKTVERVLAINEKEKKDKYLESCKTAWMHFSPFVSTVDEVLAREAKHLLKRLILHLWIKWDTPKSVITNYVETKMSMAILKATHQCLRESRVDKKIFGRSIGQDGSSLGLYRAEAL